MKRYNYTVTEADAADGKAVSTVNVVFNGEVIDYGALFDERITYSINVDTAPKQDKNPATCNALYSSVFLAGAAALTAAAARKRR